MNPARRDGLLALLGLGLAGAVRATPPPGPSRGDRVSWPAGLTLLDGQPWAARPGHRKIVVFWSTTCPFCRRHNQHLQALRPALVGQAVQLLTVAREDDGQAVRRHLAREGLDFQVTLDHRRLSPLLSPRRLVPLTVTLDADDRIEWIIPGEMSEPDVMALARPGR